MRNSVYRALAVAVIATVAVPLAAAERLAQAPPVANPQAQAEGTIPGGTAERPGGLEDKVASFVRDFYLSGETRSAEELALIYAPKVSYFGNRVWSRERILADKRAYFARWPKRDFRLLRETLKVARDPGRAQILDVSFEYDFEVASRARVSRGRGRSLLTLDLTQEGGRITRETGDVLQRW